LKKAKTEEDEPDAKKKTRHITHSTGHSVPFGLTSGGDPDAKPSVIDWMVLGVGSLPTILIDKVLDDARNPGQSSIGFSGYVTNAGALTPEKGGATLDPIIAVDPTEVSVGTTVQLTGTGFSPSSFVSVLIDGSQVDQPQTDGLGDLAAPESTANVTVYPRSGHQPPHPVQAVDLVSGKRSNVVNIQVLPK
jgi:hypothetical protein